MSHGSGEVQCEHCGAKRPNLHAFKARCPEDGRFHVVRCLLCGWWAVEPDLSGYKILGWSSPWPRRQEEWLPFYGDWSTE